MIAHLAQWDSNSLLLRARRRSKNVSHPREMQFTLSFALHSLSRLNLFVYRLSLRDWLRCLRVWLTPFWFCLRQRMEDFVYAFSALLCSQRTREENNAPGACSYLEKRDFNTRSFSIIFVRSDVCQYFHQLRQFFTLRIGCFSEMVECEYTMKFAL